jgi:hypothetical protein
MNCDTCNKHLEEADTYESIVCKKCLDAKEKLYCNRCKCSMKLHPLFVKAKATMKSKKIVLSVLALLLLIGLCVFFFPHVMFVMGFGAGFLAAITIALFLFHYIGVSIILIYDDPNFKYSWKDAGPVPCIMGILFTIVIPLVIYFLGNLILHLLK